MTKYKFDWQDVVHGSDRETLHIKYVDNGIGDIQTPEEWSQTWKQIY